MRSAVGKSSQLHRKAAVRDRDSLVESDHFVRARQGDADDDEESKIHHDKILLVSNPMKVTYFLGLALTLFFTMSDQVWYTHGNFKYKDPAHVEDKHVSSQDPKAKGIPDKTNLRVGDGQEKERKNSISDGAQIARVLDNDGKEATGITNDKKEDPKQKTGPGGTMMVPQTSKFFEVAPQKQIIIPRKQQVASPQQNSGPENSPSVRTSVTPKQYPLPVMTNVSRNTIKGSKVPGVTTPLAEAPKQDTLPVHSPPADTKAAPPSTTPKKIPGPEGNGKEKKKKKGPQQQLFVHKHNGIHPVDFFKKIINHSPQKKPGTLHDTVTTKAKQENLKVTSPNTKEGKPIQVVFQGTGPREDDGRTFNAPPILHPSKPELETEYVANAHFRSWNHIHFESFGVTRTVRPNDYDLLMEEKEHQWELQWELYEEEVARHPNYYPIHDEDHQPGMSPQLTWISKGISNCNTFHELFEGYSENNITWVGGGTYRDAMGIVDPIDVLTTGSQIQTIILKQPKVPQVDTDDSAFYSEENVFRGHRDAIVMEEFSSSSKVVDIYGYCGMSVFVEPMVDTLMKRIAPSLFIQRLNPDRAPRQRENKLSNQERLAIARELAQAVAALTQGEQGDSVVVHGDIHPGNFLEIPTAGNFLETPTEPTNTFKLSDFEIADFFPKGQATSSTSDNNDDTERQRGNGEACRPPEGQVNGLSDVYSLGCVYFTVLTGLFGGHDIFWSAEEPGKPKRLIIPDEHLADSADPVEGKFAALIRNMTSKQPEARPPIQQVIEVLNQMKANS